MYELRVDKKMVIKRAVLVVQVELKNVKVQV